MVRQAHHPERSRGREKIDIFEEVNKMPLIEGKNSPTFQKLRVKLSGIGGNWGFSGFFSDFRGKCLFLS